MPGKRFFLLDTTEEDIWNSCYVIFQQSAEKTPKAHLSDPNSVDMFLTPRFFLKHVMGITRVWITVQTREILYAEVSKRDVKVWKGSSSRKENEYVLFDYLILS